MSVVEIIREEGLYLIRPTGAEDLSSQLSRDDLTGFIARNVERLPMLVDLGHLRIIQSAGVGLLFYLLTEAARVGISVVIANPSELVTKVLNMAGVDDLTKIYETEAEARAKLL